MLNIDFSLADIVEVEERIPEGMNPHDVPEYLASIKGDAYKSSLKDNDLCITADTIVLLGDKIIGKPTDKEDACRLLRELSGKKHKVITGVCLTTKQQRIHFSETTEVSFAKLSDHEIEYYVNNFRPLDKAGAYGIQEWIGAVAVEGIDGCFYNVMGLPVHSLYNHLRNI